MQLRGNLRTMTMNGVGEIDQAGQELVIGDRDLVDLIAANRPRDACNPRNDQACTALGLFFVIADNPFAALAVRFGKARAHCGHRDAVPKHHRPDLAG